MNDMDNWNKICGFAAIFFLFDLQSTAQKSETIKYKVPVAFTIKPLPVSNIFTGVLSKNLSVKAPASVKTITQDHYTQHFGFFCKKELLMEKATKIPLRFRLGSLQHCNYLEGER